MNLFETLLEIKTGKKDLPIKAVYVSAKDAGRYYVYYYDRSKHAFYINDLEGKKSPPNIIEQVITLAYKQEMNDAVDLIKKIQSQMMPKLFCLSMHKATGMLEIQKLKLKALK